MLLFKIKLCWVLCIQKSREVYFHSDRGGLIEGWQKEETNSCFDLISGTQIASLFCIQTVFSEQFDYVRWNFCLLNWENLINWNKKIFLGLIWIFFRWPNQFGDFFFVKSFEGKKCLIGFSTKKCFFDRSRNSRRLTKRQNGGKST